MGVESRKKIAVEFLSRAAKAQAKESARKLFAAGAKHHNPFFPAGIDALVSAMDASARDHPKRMFRIQRVLGEEDLVAVHSHVVHEPGEPGMAVVHLFRFEREKIVEFWDVGQSIPKESPNKDGMF